MKREAIFYVMFGMMLLAAAFIAVSEVIATFDLQPLYEEGGYAAKVADFIGGLQVFFASTAGVFILSMVVNVFGYLHADYRQKAASDSFVETLDYNAKKLFKTIFFFETPIVGFALAVPKYAWIGVEIALAFQIIKTVYKDLFGT